MLAVDGDGGPRELQVRRAGRQRHEFALAGAQSVRADDCLLGARRTERGGAELVERAAAVARDR